MNCSVSHIILLKKLLNKNLFANDSLKRLESIVFRTNMEHGFILIVAVFEICFSLVEIFLQHWHIIFLECIEERQVSIVVNHIWSRFDLINNLVLLIQTDDMFNSLALVVLCATSKVERVISTEPIEYFFVSIPCTLKEGILSIFISHLQTLEFEILEYL